MHGWLCSVDGFVSFSLIQHSIICMWRIHRIKWEWSLSHYRHHCNALLACLYWYVYGSKRTKTIYNAQLSCPFIQHLICIRAVDFIFFHSCSGILFDVESEKINFFMNWSNSILFFIKEKLFEKYILIIKICKRSIKFHCINDLILGLPYK